MKHLYESNQSKFIQYWMKRDVNFKEACMALLNKGYDINKFTDNMFAKMDPSDAFKLKGKKGDAYFKFWMANDHFMFCTWANTMIDSRFEWDHKKRNKCIGDYRDTDGYLRSNDYINNASYVLVIKYEDMPKVESIQKTRKEQKKDALALMSNRDIKRLNIARYQKLISQNSWSDGSEFNMIQNIAKPLQMIPENRFMDAIVKYDIDDILKDFAQNCQNSIYELIKHNFIVENDEFDYMFSTPRSSQKQLIEACKKAKNVEIRFESLMPITSDMLNKQFSGIQEKFRKELVKFMQNVIEVKSSLISKISDKDASFGELETIFEYLQTMSRNYKEVGAFFSYHNLTVDNYEQFLASKQRDLARYISEMQKFNVLFKIIKY